MSYNYYEYSIHEKQPYKDPKAGDKLILIASVAGVFALLYLFVVYRCCRYCFRSFGFTDDID